MVEILKEYIDDSLGGYDAYFSYVSVEHLLDKIEEYMIPKTTMSEPEYHENGKQLQTKVVNKWDE